MKKVLSIVGLLLWSFCLKSCLVGVENQIIPDEKVDRRLVGPWVGIPLFDTKEELEEANESLDPRRLDDIGCNGYFIVGETDAEQLEILNIESFDKSGGAMIIQGRRAKTRKHKGRNFLLFDFEDEKDNGQIVSHYVIEYAIKNDGALWLWFLSIDELEAAIKVHPMKASIEKRAFGTATIKGSSEEILDFYADPKIQKLFYSAGRYQKLDVPTNARIRHHSPSLKRVDGE